MEKWESLDKESKTALSEAEEKVVFTQVRIKFYIELPFPRKKI